MSELQKREDLLFECISKLIEVARKRVKTTIDSAMVYTYYGIGKYIVEYEQHGKERAEYGSQMLNSLSKKLTIRFGNGWSVETLKKCRFFFKTYRNSSIGSSLLTKFEAENNFSELGLQRGPNSEITTVVNPDRPFTLSWSHYLVLMRIKDKNERLFYEIESYKRDWSVRQLKREYGSSLYERLALSRDRDEVIRLSNEGQTIEKPQDIVKDPLALEFIGIKPDSIYSESRLENAIISKLQMFLLEMGKGFLFEARQKRFTFNEKHFYVDLVLYNRLLQCYVLVDLKTEEISHQDLGQMQMYVNYYDRYVKTDFEKPTIGILLCKDKDDALVELTLPKDANIYATAYQLYLPNKMLLKSKMREWIEEYEEHNDNYSPESSSKNR